MVRLQFQGNTKMVIVPTNNIFDQKYCRNITRTSLSNSVSAESEMIDFAMKKSIPRL